MALAAATIAGGAGDAWAITASAWDQTDFTEVRLIAGSDAVGEGETVRLGLQFRLEPGWKIYWRSPGDAGSPPVLRYDGSSNLAAADMSWPAPLRFFEAGELETVGYLDATVFPLVVRLERPGEALSVRAVVDYQACETICIPFTANLALDLPAGPTRANPFTQMIDRYAAKVPGAPEGAGIAIEAVGVRGAPPDQVLQIKVRSETGFESPELFVEGPPEYRFPASTSALSADSLSAELLVPVQARGGRDLMGAEITVTLADDARAVVFTVPVAPVAPVGAAAAAADHGWWVLASVLGVALLGGLILNLMPCVLPVLSIKLLGVISHGGGDRRQVTASFLASAAGIVVSFLALAAGAVVLKLGGSMVGWGMQFQEPLFLVFLAVVLVLFACNLMGFYEFRMPAWVGGLAMRGVHDGDGPTLGGSFWTGALATLLATPCSAPFLGTAVGFALSRGPGEIFTVFAALGLGMAAPYLVVAAAPGLATRLPRPGPWMVWVRRTMGLALAATAIWLLWVISAQSGLGGALVLAVVLMAIASLLWLMGVRWQGARQAGAAAAAVAGLSAFAFLVPGQFAPPPSDGLVHAAASTAWRPFDQDGIASLVAAGQVVFVDVTADWCVTCKVNKSLVLQTAEITQRLEDPAVVAMRADWTTPDPAIANYLTSFGRYGIPFNVVYGPGAPDGLVLSELLSKSEVLRALETAGAGPRVGPQARAD
jgi:suppressor for copper-sensitivity B